MPTFEVDFTFNAPDWGTTTIIADDYDQAEFEALTFVKDNYEGAHDVDITAIREIVN